MSPPFLLLLAVFFGAGAIGMPIAFAMLTAGIAYLLAAGQDPGLVAEQTVDRRGLTHIHKSTFID